MLLSFLLLFSGKKEESTRFCWFWLLPGVQGAHFWYTVIIWYILKIKVDWLSVILCCYLSQYSKIYLMLKYSLWKQKCTMSTTEVNPALERANPTAVKLLVIASLSLGDSFRTSDECCWGNPQKFSVQLASLEHPSSMKSSLSLVSWLLAAWVPALFWFSLSCAF